MYAIVKLQKLFGCSKKEDMVFKYITIFTLTGTAGVWRISAINEVGGWKDRTTVEDMDLAVRASLKGWKFLYVGDVKVLKFAVIHDSIQQRRSSVICKCFATTIAGQKRTPKYLQGLPTSTASMDLWSCQLI